MDSIDIDGNGLISALEIKKALSQFKDCDDISLGLHSLLAIIVNEGSDISYPTFKAAVLKMPRVRAQRIQWARALKFDAAFAKHLPVGNIFDGLAALKSMSWEDLVKVCDEFCKEVRSIVHAEWIKLSGETGSTSSPDAANVDVMSVMNKFKDEGGFLGNFGNQFMFHHGLEAELGLPDPCILRAILREHIYAVDSENCFVTPNYGLVATPLNGNSFLSQVAKKQHSG